MTAKQKQKQLRLANQLKTQLKPTLTTLSKLFDDCPSIGSYHRSQLAFRLNDSKIYHESLISQLRDSKVTA